MWLGIPKNRKSIVARGRKGFAIRAKGDADDSFRVAGKGWIDRAMRRCIPQDYGFIIAARGKHLSIQAEGDASYLTGVLCERVSDHLLALHIPKNDALISTT